MLPIRCFAGLLLYVSKVLPPAVAALNPAAESLRIVVAIVVVWLLLNITVLPEIAVGPLETVVVIAFGASNLGHTRVFCFSQCLLFSHSPSFSDASAK